MFTTWHAMRGTGVPHFPRFRPPPSPHGPRGSPPGSPARPPTVPLASRGGPAGSPPRTPGCRPARHRRTLPNGNDKGRTEKDTQQRLAGRGRPAVAASITIAPGDHRPCAAHRRYAKEPEAPPAGPSPSPFAAAVPPVSRHDRVAARSYAEHARRQSAGRRATRVRPGPAPPAGPPRLPVRHEAGNLRDPLAPTSSPPGFPPWAGGARRCAVRAWRDDDGSCVESPLGTQISARARPAQRWPRSPIVPASLRARRCDPGGRTPGSAPVATAGVDGGGPSAPARGLRMRARCACSTALAGGTWLRTRDDPKWDRRGTRGAGEEASAPRSGTIEEPGPVDGGDGRHNVMAPGPNGRCERVLQWVGASERARRAAAERPRACAGYDARTVEAGSFGCATRGSDP